MGKLSVELQYVNVISVLKQTIDSISPAAAKKHIEIKEDLSVPEVFISADSARLKQIFWNILSNAIKFTPNYGRIEIKISVSLKNQKQFIHISIIDNGKGIKPEFIPFIFDRFAQIDSSSTRTHGGLGLGLALVHSLLKLQGGEIEANSQGENYGSTFTVTFPLMESDQMLVYRNQNISALQDGISIENTYLQGIKLLLVDDGEQTREALCSALFYFGAQVCLAASVREALDIYQKDPLDIIISDIAMPEEDGYDLLRKIRQTEHYKKKKNIIIALTAYAGPENFEKAISAGFDYHLAKPVDIIKLVMLIKEKYLSLHKVSNF
jgi:CheY-like chemotaxis protein/two-component sensor histidine kinase